MATIAPKTATTASKAAGPSASAAIQPSLRHHDHRFRIDFEASEAIEQTRRNRERREAFLATDKQFADTAEQFDDDFLMAVLPLPSLRTAE